MNPFKEFNTNPVTNSSMDPSLNVVWPPCDFPYGSLYEFFMNSLMEPRLALSVNSPMAPSKNSSMIPYRNYSMNPFRLPDEFLH